MCGHVVPEYWNMDLSREEMDICKRDCQEKDQVEVKARVTVRKDVRVPFPLGYLQKARVSSFPLRQKSSSRCIRGFLCTGGAPPSQLRYIHDHNINTNQHYLLFASNTDFMELELHIFTN